jgi:hypothetical protein
MLLEAIGQTASTELRGQGGHIKPEDHRGQAPISGVGMPRR